MTDHAAPGHRRFDYQDTSDLQADLVRLSLAWPQEEDLSCLGSPLAIGRGSSPNRLAVQPMEGCDGTLDGCPSDLTLRRYHRFASGGSGLLWVEATAVVPEGRANPRQLWLHEANVSAFAGLVSQIDAVAPARPYKVLQLTHSGRYSRPVDQAFPQVAVSNPWLDRP